MAGQAPRRALQGDPPARCAQRDYIDRARDLRIAAAGHRAFGRAVLSRECLQAALVLEQAAVAEYVDPQPAGLATVRGTS